MGLALPGVDDECAKVLQGLLADLGLSAVTDEFGWGAAAADIFLECAEEFAVCFASICITNLCLGADLKLGAGRSVVNGGCVRVDVVCSDGLVAAEDIESWELCFVVSLQELAVGHACVLRCLRKGTLDDVGG